MSTVFKVLSYATRLSPLDAFAVSEVLDNCVDQLHILGHVVPVPQQPEESFKTLEERFDPELRSRSDQNQFLLELLEVAPSYTAEEENLMKLQRDRLYCERVLTDVSKELRLCGTFSNLIRDVQLREVTEEEEYNLVVNGNHLAEVVEKLKAEVDQEGAKGEKLLKLKEEESAHLKDQLQEIRLKGSMESHYVAHWEESRCSQNVLRLQTKEQEINKGLAKCQEQLDKESRVAAEIESFLNGAQKSSEKQTVYWSGKYESDTYSKDEELMKLKAVKLRDFHRLQDLALLYKEHDEALQEWLEHKRELERERLQRELEISSATIIQAWWRGIMVRRGLGRFKKLLKGKKGGKGKNSGKKKDGSGKKSGAATPTKKKK